MNWNILPLLLMGMASSALAQTPSDRMDDEIAIKRVVEEFISRRENGDVEGVRALLTATADQRITSGRMRTGREEVVSGSVGTTQGTGGQRSITLEAIRFLGDDVAIADGPYNIIGRNDGTDLFFRTTMVFVRESGVWKIEAIRNMRPVQ